MNPIRHDELVARIDQRAPACGEIKVIAIDGRSGAGKTDYAASLGARLQAPVFHVEDVYPGWSGLDATPPLLVDRLLAPLAVGAIGSIPRWDWARGRPSTEIRVVPGPILILEGVGSGARICRPFLSMLIWIDAPPTIRKRRALERDGTTFAPFWDMWAAQEDALFARDDIRAAADAVIRYTEDGILDPNRRNRGEGNG